MKRLAILFAVMAIAITAWSQFGIDNPLPMDPDVRYGKLPNGLTYYIWHNEKPEKRCEFRIVQKVGAILEEDHQNGLAHFLEHMCFNGTEHFPGKGIINYFESVGVNFGAGINAFTSLEETVYMLSDVPTTRQGILDSALLVIYDWSCGVSLLDEEIDNERGVIREEWRTRNNAYERMRVKAQKIEMPGTQYAKRDVIGDTAVINNFSYQALRDYYRKWYGPDMQAVIVVGDIDVDTMEQKIISLFSSARPREGMTPRTVFPVGDNEEPIVGVVLDKESSFQSFEMGFKRQRPSDEYRLSYAGYEFNKKVGLIGSCFLHRIYDLLDNPDVPLEFGYSYFGPLGGEKDALTFTIHTKDGEEKAAYRMFITEIERLRRYGLTQKELDIAKKAAKEEFEISYIDRHNRQSATMINSCIYHFLDNDGSFLTSCDFDKEYYDNCLDKITLDELNAVVKELMPAGERNIYIIAMGKDKADANGVGCDKCDMPSEAELMQIFREVCKGEVSSPDYQVEERPLVSKHPKPGKIVSRVENNAMGTTELLLSNNIKVIVKQTDNEKGMIQYSAQSDGGFSSYSTSDMINACYSDVIVCQNGVGDFTPVQLSKQLIGKQVNIYPYVGRYDEDVSGNSSVKDFETMMQLNWLYFTAPRRDDKRFEAWMKDNKKYLETEMSEPRKRFSKRMNEFLYKGNERYFRLDTNNLKQIDQKRAIQIYKERFANPADFTFFFVGDIDLGDSAIVAAIEKWLGGMKTSNKFEKWTDDRYYMMEGEHCNYFREPMTTKTATNSLTVTGYGFEYNLKNILTSMLLGNILDTRYLESIREREGGSYGVQTSCSFSVRPRCMIKIYVEFDTDPDKQNRLISIVYDEIEKIIAEGPLESDLSKEKEILIKQNEKSLIDNYQWMSKIKMFYEYGINYLDDYDGVVNSITDEDIRQMLKAIYEQRNHIEVVMMPAR